MTRYFSSSPVPELQKREERGADALPYPAMGWLCPGSLNMGKEERGEEREKELWQSKWRDRNGQRFFSLSREIYNFFFFSPRGCEMEENRTISPS